MTPITNDNLLISRDALAETCDIIATANLRIDERVRAVFVSGSRGPAGNWRDDSDIDISLVLDTMTVDRPMEQDELLKEILSVTLNAWKGRVELDAALLFSINDCFFECFLSGKRDCRHQALDCFGIYKLQKGFSGIVPKIGIDVDKVRPVSVVWKKQGREG